MMSGDLNPVELNATALKAAHAARQKGDHMPKKTIYSPAYRRLIQRLRERRQEVGMTQGELADRLGRSRAWVQRIEACETRADFLQTVDLHKALKIDIHEAVRLVQEEAP